MIRIADEDLMPRPFNGEDPRWQHIGNGWNVSKDGREDYTKWYSNNYMGFVSKTYGNKWYGNLNGPSMPRKFGPFSTAEEAMDVVDDWAHSVVEYEENAVSASKKISKWTREDGKLIYVGDNGYSALIERAGNYRNAGYTVYWYDPNGEEIAHGAYQYYNETRENAKRLTDNPELIEQSWPNNVSR